MSAGLGDRDCIVKAQVGMGVLHHEIHDGEAFHISGLFEDVADDASVDLVIRTGSKELHIILTAAAAGDAYGYLYEGTDADDDGTLVTPYNKRRANSETSSARTSQGDKINSVGTAIDTILIPGGTKNQATGGDAAERDEWVLTRNSTYLLRITNKAGATKDISVGATWYEEPVPGTYG